MNTILVFFGVGLIFSLVGLIIMAFLYSAVAGLLALCLVSGIGLVIFSGADFDFDPFP